MTPLSQLSAALAGRYTLEREVGAGGMATVYLARDLKHDRNVALKVLKPELGAVLGVERFLAEIKVTANLQHPNLLPLFDSGEANGLLFYVMPFVEGESLRARLDREKQLPVDEAVQIAAAVAGALAHAHKHGVIHRDLKPENILMQEGQPLIADFGIALAVSNAGGGRITQTGLSLGTPQYMSPEQATGDRAVDGRTDIYSLGAVTYEMLTGEAPHTGSTSQAVIARVLTERPRSVRASRPNVPVHVEAAIDRALEKLAADRFATARDFADAVTGKVVLATPPTTAHTIGSRWSPREKLIAGVLGAGIALAGLTTGLLLNGPAESPPAADIRFSFETPGAAGPNQISVSPDGRVVAFAGLADDGSQHLWIRPLDRTEAEPLPMGGVGSGFWSPDSKELAYSSEGKLMRIRPGGGGATTICECRGGQGTWGPDSTIVLADQGQLHRVPVHGGTATPIEITGTTARGWTHPWFLPDGRHVLAVAKEGPDQARGIYAVPIDGGAPTFVMASETRTAFALPNHLFFVREGMLYVQSFDPRRLRLEGEPVPVAPDVGVNTTNGAAGFGVSAGGTIAYRPTDQRGTRSQAYWFRRTGVKLDSIGPAIPDLARVALSPDNSRLAAVTLRNGDNSIWVVDLRTMIASRLAPGVPVSSAFTWTSDSKGVTYMAGRDGQLVTRALGGGEDSLGGGAWSQSETPPAYSPDGTVLLVARRDSLFAIRRQEGPKPTLLAIVRGLASVRFSPDGRRISYGSTESGRAEVYVASYPALDNRVKVSAAGGVQARWRADGKELFYLDQAGKAWVAAVREVPGDGFGTPQPLFQTGIRNPYSNTPQWDVSADGQRFAMIDSPDAGYIPRIVVFSNWKAALPRP
jgi:serine/threonine-protein kinase